MNSTSYDFYIQNPKWQRNTFIGFLILGAVGAIVMTILWFILKFDWGILAGTMVMVAFLVILPLIGIYVWNREIFYLKNETFTCIKPFKKSQSASVAQISRVEVSQKAFIHITFFGKNGEKLISFLDDGTSFRNNEFIAALMHYNIPIITK